MKVSMLTMSAFLAAGCGDKGEDSATEVVKDRFGEFIFVTDAPVGDLACYDGSGTWLDFPADPSCQQTVPMTGEVEDFETGDSVEDATVEIFFNDDVTTTPDVSYVSGENGAVSGKVATCQPIAYTVSTQFGETKTTSEAHTVMNLGKSVETQFNSVSDVTYRLIPSLLGVSPEEDKGVIAGTAYDCNGDPIANAQVVVKDAQGNVPESLVVKYFIEEFPNRDQPATSADGLWVAINVPPGAVTIEMYVTDGAGGHTLMGATVLESYADSINISNIYTGRPDGVLIPESCRSACK